MEFAEAIEMPTFSKTTRESNRAIGSVNVIFEMAT